MILTKVASVCKCTPTFARWVVSGGASVLAIIIGIIILVTISKPQRLLAGLWLVMWVAGVGTTTYYSLDENKRWPAFIGGSVGLVGISGLIITAGQYCHVDEMSRRLDTLLGEQFSGRF